MKYWISTLLLIVCSLSFSQEKDAVESFLSKLNRDYPQFKLVYLNDNLQMHSFEVIDDQIIILDIFYGNKKATRADKKCTFYLLNLKDNIIQDTLVLQPLDGGTSMDKILNVDRSSKNIFLRPSYGTLPTEPPLRFFQSLSIQIPLKEGVFGSIQAKQDRDDYKEEPYVYYKNENNFKRSKDRKTISMNIGEKVRRQYRKKDIPENDMYEPLLYQYLFPYNINPRGLMVLDAMASELIMANQEQHKIKKVTLPPDYLQSRYGVHLLYDEAFKQVYLRLSLIDSEKLYWLNGENFEPIGLQLPKVWDESDGGISRKRPMVVHEGKLYIMLNIKEGGQTFDGIFMAVL